jgi:hypothetical protein
VPPSSFWTTFAAATRESMSVTSARIASAPFPSSSASASIRSVRRARRATRSPRALSARAVAAPMPEDAPVMTATRVVSVASGMGPPGGGWSVSEVFPFVRLSLRSGHHNCESLRGGIDRAPMAGLSSHRLDLLSRTQKCQSSGVRLRAGSPDPTAGPDPARSEEGMHFIRRFRPAAPPSKRVSAYQATLRADLHELPSSPPACSSNTMSRGSRHIDELPGIRNGLRKLWVAHARRRRVGIRAHHPQSHRDLPGRGRHARKVLVGRCDPRISRVALAPGWRLLRGIYLRLAAATMWPKSDAGRVSGLARMQPVEVRLEAQVERSE